MYINVSNKYVSPFEKIKKGTRGYTGIESMCIGVTFDPEHPEIKKLYANTAYLEMLSGKELPDPHAVADSLAIGFTCWITEAADRSGLAKDLTDVFGEIDAQLILDLAAYVLSRGSAVMKHFPAWGREHVLFSENIRDEMFIGQFLKDHLTVPRIEKFRNLWTVHHIGDGRVYLCSELTGENGQAEGVFIDGPGYAGDDSLLCQVNTDISQSDGLPLTYQHVKESTSERTQAAEIMRLTARKNSFPGRM